MRKPSLRKAASGLEQLQRAIAGALMKPLTADDEMRAENAAVAEEFIKPNDRLSAFERLQIYNQQYWWRLLGAFGEDFRGLRAVLGERKFDRLAMTYLEVCGSTSWNLRNLGSKLVGFLEANPKLTQPGTALAVDVARVEWARVLAFDEPAREIIEPAKLARTPPHRLKLGLQPYLVLLELSHPVDDLMRKLKRTELSVVSNAMIASERRRSTRLAVCKSRTPIYLAVHRMDLSVYYKRLDPEAWQILTALGEGRTLEEAIAVAFEKTRRSPEACTELLREWFSRWTEFGWFCTRANR